MNALTQVKRATLVFVIALSVTTAAATTTDVIFSFGEDEGEYADTDWRQTAPVTSMARRSLAAILEAARFFSSLPLLMDGCTRCSTALRAVSMEVNRTKESHWTATATYTAPRLPADQVTVKADAV